MKRFLMISMMVGTVHFGTVTTSDAFLSGLWDTVMGWFGGGKKKDAGIEAQLTQALQATNQSQNNLIMAVNSVVELQGQMQNLNDAKQKEELEKRMTAMQAAVDQNAQIYGQLMTIRDSLAQSGQLQAVESQFAPYVAKQQEIEGVYPKVQDRYNELKAFSAEPAPAVTPATPAAGSAPVGADVAARAVLVQPWQSPEARAAIDAYLKQKDRDKWNGPKSPFVTATTPPAAHGKDRYQYLFETYPDIRNVISKLGSGNAVSSPAAPAAPVNSVSVTPAAPAAPVASIRAPAAPATTYRHMVPTNNMYDKAALRLKRDEIYQKMLKLQAEGKMNSEEYRDIYLEYTKLSDQLR